MKGLTPQTQKVFEKISHLECIKPYTLVGGTALALQLATRLSEDLDFMSWRVSKKEKREVNWPIIQKELEGIGTVESYDILGMDHVLFLVDGVKLSFYANPNYSPLSADTQFHNNIKIADKKSIGAMKMEVLLRRSNFRDYYDIYSLIKDGVSVKEMMDIALKYSGHRLKSKNLIAILTMSERFVQDSDFEELEPVYKVTPKEIENLLREMIKSEK